MKKFFKEYFNFSKREQNGLIVLFILLIAIVGIDIFVSVRNSKHKVDFSDFETEIDSFLIYQQTHFDDSELFAFDPNSATREDLLRLGLSPKSVNGIINYREKGYKFYKPEDITRVRTLKPKEYETIKEYIVIERPQYSKDNNYTHKYNQANDNNKIELFEFDPNTASIDELEQLGFKHWQAENILKYRSKGGSFKQPSDISKIHGVDAEFAEKLMPYIKIESYNKENASYDIIVNLNTATETDLQKLKGIGASYSKRIIAYREKLGGFVAEEQLREVYGFTEELYNSISPYIKVDNGSIRTININTADFKALVSHPYIDKNTANAILKYREFAQNIKSTDELVKQKAISRSIYDKISRYISTE